MGNWKRFLLIGVTAYLLFLIINIPATLLIPQINQRLPNSAVSLGGSQGTIWRGSTDITIKPSGRSTMSGQFRFFWSVRFTDLIFGQLGVDYDVKGADIAGSGHLASGFGPLNLSIESGSLGPTWINPLLSAQGARISQPVTMNDVYLQIDLAEKRTEEAGGVLAWAGGNVPVRKPQAVTLNLPAVQGRISATEQQTLLIEVEEQAGKKALLSAELLQTGWAKIRVLKRIQPLIGMGQSRTPDAVMLELQHKVL